MAKVGTPSGLVTTTVFQGLALSELTARGVSGLPMLVIEHPLGGQHPDAVLRRAHEAFAQLTTLLGRPE